MNLFEEFWSYVVISAPYLLFGLLVAGFVHTFFSRDNIQRFLGANNFASVVKAALFGVPLPMCSCSVVPAAISLRENGASNAATSSFLISTPQTGIDSLFLTYGLMDVPMLIIRPLSAFLSAFLAGTFQFLFNKSAYQAHQEHQAEDHCCPACGGAPVVQTPSLAKRLLDGQLYAFSRLSDDMSFWLLIGLVSGALINTFVPNDFLGSLGPIQGRLGIILVGIPFYICASASTPLAVSLVMKGLSPGTALLFLMVGPATNITNILVMQKYIGKLGVVINTTCIAISAVIFSFVVDFLYEWFQWSPIWKMQHQHVHGASWWMHASGIILCLLLMKGLWKENIKPHLAKQKEPCCHD